MEQFQLYILDGTKAVTANRERFNQWRERHEDSISQLGMILDVADGAVPVRNKAKRAGRFQFFFLPISQGFDGFETKNFLIAGFMDDGKPFNAFYSNYHSAKKWWCSNVNKDYQCRKPDAR